MCAFTHNRLPTSHHEQLLVVDLTSKRSNLLVNGTYEAVGFRHWVASSWRPCSLNPGNTHLASISILLFALRLSLNCHIINFIQWVVVYWAEETNQPVTAKTGNNPLMLGESSLPVLSQALHWACSGPHHKAPGKQSWSGISEITQSSIRNLDGYV